MGFDFDVDIEAGSGAFEAVKAEEFVGNELKVVRGLEGDEFLEKCDDWGGPRTALVAAAGVDLKSFAVLEPAASKLVESIFAYLKTLASF